MRKGSALLIVLGMISFMLFSGLAFSVYMRQTRMPSSFLRRTTFTRQLTKAALAQAMEELDYAIANDPHPNVRLQGDSSENFYSSDDSDAGQEGNYWDHRVYVRNKNYAPSSNSDETHEYNDTTISTLTLEGLAYLPPSLINEARYYSRHTPTAQWQRFRFDAGRYAYCAIDVSDYFDVNRIIADAPRSSAASRRITLAHIFDKSASDALHSEPIDGAAELWDTWLCGDREANLGAWKDGVRTVDYETGEVTFNDKTPLVSLADFNLFMAFHMEKEKDLKFNKTGNQYIKSPFVEYLKDAYAIMYPDYLNDNGAYAEAYRSMTFVTDSLFSKASKSTDLADPANQPYDPADLKQDNMDLSKVMWLMDARHTSKDYYRKMLSNIGMATLFDYLDEDSLPISLAIPTVERNPMICAIQPAFEQNVKIQVSKTAGPLQGPTQGSQPATTPDSQGKREVSQTVKYIIDGNALCRSLKTQGLLKCLALYPFLHGSASGNYSLDGKLAFFLTRNNDKLPLIVPGGEEGYDNFSFANTLPNVAQLNSGTGIFTVPLEGTISVPPSIHSEADAICLSEVNSPIEEVADFSEEKPWIEFTYRWKQDGTPVPGSQNQYNWADEGDGGHEKWDNVVNGGRPRDDDSRETTCSWYPIDISTGEPDSTFKTIYESLQSGSQVSYNLNMAVWLRIKNGEDTVDLVPASIQDDKELGLLSSTVRTAINEGANLREYFRKVEGQGHHIMRFDMTPDRQFRPSSIQGDSALTCSFAPNQKMVMVADPRYNHNPANWFSVDSTDIKTAWQDPNNNPYKSRNYDLFMSVSDQGYLQSIYELGFLPRLADPDLNQIQNDFNYVCDLTGEMLARTVQDGQYDSFPVGFNASSQRDVMWRSYRVCSISGNDNNRNDPIGENDPMVFAQLGLVSGDNGIKVNPFSDSLEILTAAFANTPLDWSHASTNSTMNKYAYQGGNLVGADEFNEKYAWNSYNESAKLAWEDLQDIADAYYDKVRESPGNWRMGFARLPWCFDNTHKLLNLGNDDNGQPNTLHFNNEIFSVDKKFLYGFWQDCFAANQQLFLIFVRAEPMMMGGGVAGTAPPQLSSRAVALVWRDPNARANSSAQRGTANYTPHSMRVLFYHPLD